MSNAEEIGKLARLLEATSLTSEEFAKLKQEVIDRDDSQGIMFNFLFTIYSSLCPVVVEQICLPTDLSNFVNWANLHFLALSRSTHKTIDSLPLCPSSSKDFRFRFARYKHIMKTGIVKNK